jgi:hypothetical protein
MSIRKKFVAVMKKNLILLALLTVPLSVYGGVKLEGKLTDSGDANSIKEQNTPKKINAITDDMKFERSEFMRTFIYKNLTKMYLDVSPSGAYSKVNIEWERTGQGKWFIEQQRSGAYAVIAGIAMDDAEVIRRGMKIIKWGVQQQRSDGSFDCADNFHSTSLFLTAAARAMLHLQASKYEVDYVEDLRKIKFSLLKAAQWMVRPENEKRRELGNKPRTHRFYVLASGIGQVGVLNDVADLKTKAAQYAREGLALQSVAGFNPESGGWDSSYNAAGLTFAAHYYMNAADQSLRPAVYEMFRKAVQWEASRVDRNGIVSTEGNERVSPQTKETTRIGAQKDKVNIGEISRAFAFWSYFSGDESYLKLAQLVFSAKQP